MAITSQLPIFKHARTKRHPTQNDLPGTFGQPFTNRQLLPQAFGCARFELSVQSHRTVLRQGRPGKHRSGGVFQDLFGSGYVNNIGSDRKLIEYCRNCLEVWLFIKYDIDEPLPWHSTIDRTRQLYGEEVFLGLFRKVLVMCVHKGMVRGRRQAINSAFVKANASLDSLLEKEVYDDAEAYADELNEGSEYKVSTSRTKRVESHHEWKKNKPTKVCPAIASQTKVKLSLTEITIDQIAADAGYSSAEALRYCKNNRIDATYPTSASTSPPVKDLFTTRNQTNTNASAAPTPYCLSRK